MEKEEKWKEAIALYESLIPLFKDNPKIAAIAIQRVEWIEKNHPDKG